MDLSKSAINKKYDQLMSQLKSGDLSQKQFKTAADRLYKLYHSDANKAQRAKDAKPAAKKTTKATSSTQQAKKPAPKKPAAKKPAAKKPTTGKSKVFKSMYAPNKMVGKDVKNRSSMPYAGKFPGEPDKEEKKKKPRNLGKGSFRNFYK